MYLQYFGVDLGGSCVVSVFHGYQLFIRRFNQDEPLDERPWRFIRGEQHLERNYVLTHISPTREYVVLASIVCTSSTTFHCEDGGAQHRSFLIRESEIQTKSTSPLCHACQFFLRKALLHKE